MQALPLLKDGVAIERITSGHLSQIAEFDCGAKDENEYLKIAAFANQSSHLSETFLLFEKENRKLISYITLSFGSFKLASDKKIGGLKIRKKPFRIYANNLPCLLIGKLATDKNEIKRGGASHLLAFAYQKAVEIDRVLALPFLALDAYLDKIEFYTKNGFKVAYAPRKGDRTAALYLQIF